MYNQYTQERPITMENQNIEQIHEYNYLGQLVHSEGKQEQEILKRIKTGWKTMGKHSSIFRSIMPMCLKMKVFNQCVLPAMAYGYETGTFNNRLHQKLQTSQRIWRDTCWALLEETENATNGLDHKLK